ncbi:acetyltransferase [Paraburkholderia azotifigens]|uniref:acetyltransferase n=1 Tax=Paraburkholderia azotifigens TaxID=2057004 RepID=UPI00316BA28F
MTQFDVFNGDADGICALHQLRLKHPVVAQLVTGVKRDIRLLRHVNACPGDSVTVLDVSLDANRDSLRSLLGHGVNVEYFDHHFSGRIPHAARLIPHIDTSADTCTGLIVNRYLRGENRLWAVVAAYGDNLADAAHRVATSCGLPHPGEQRLRELGEAINYNAYGESIVDLIVDPATMYREIQPFSSPLDFIAASSLPGRLTLARNEDIDSALRYAAVQRSPNASAYMLPDAAWSRRVRGEFANLVARREPSHGHAVLVPRQDGKYVVSVRAPVGAPCGADQLCREFGGSGRLAAAGIDELDPSRIDEFVAALAAVFDDGH